MQWKQVTAAASFISSIEDERPPANPQEFEKRMHDRVNAAQKAGTKLDPITAILGDHVNVPMQLQAWVIDIPEPVQTTFVTNVEATIIQFPGLKTYTLIFTVFFKNITIESIRIDLETDDINEAQTKAETCISQWFHFVQEDIDAITDGFGIDIT